ncbi:MAG: hypothetical protein ABSB11_07855 [Sedimentisphaerales bacterium]|jgi:hypothetical protein
MWKRNRKADKSNKDEIRISLPGGIFENMKIKLPAITKDSHAKEGKSFESNRNMKCEALDCEIPKLLGLLADIATNLWRARNRNDAKEQNAISDNIRKILRHYDNAWGLLVNSGFEIHDHTNEPYAHGADLKVIAFQPMPGYGTETIAETIKPTIYFKNHKIQRGEVIVAMPIKDDGANKNQNNIAE